MTKQFLRQLYKQKRLDLSASQRLKLDDLLLIQFQRLQLPDLSVLMTFYPLEKHAEVNTDLLTRYLQFVFSDIHIAYPVVSATTQEMKAVITTDETDFTENIFGIPEPVEDDATKPISPAEIDIIFVPLLAFDQGGYRVGYGKGYYDRFLVNCSPDTIKVGFSYFEPVDKIDDTNQYDVPLNYCITPERIYEF